MLQQEWECRALTGMGMQSPIIIAVTDKATRDALSAANAKIAGMPEGTDPFYGAPVILIVLAKKDVVTHIYDGSLVMGNLMNAAKGITDEYEGIGHCALGYAAAPLNDPAPRKENYVYYI